MMTDHQQVYKRYSTQVKRNNILLLKQKDQKATLMNQLQQDINENQPEKNQNQFKDNFIFKPADENNLEPIIFKRFQEYFKKSIEYTNQSKIFNEFIQHQTIKTDKKRRNQKIFSYTSTNLSNFIESDKNVDKNRFINERKANYSSISKYEPLRSTSIKDKQNSVILQQVLTDPNLSDIKLSPTRNRKRERLNQSIDLSKILNQTLNEQNSKLQNQFHTLLSNMQEIDSKNQEYLKIQSSILVDRKTVPSLLKSPQGKMILDKEELRRSIRKRIEDRNQVFQQSYKEKIRSRSPSPSKIAKRVNFLDFINPLKKQQFTLTDVIKVSLVNSMIDEVKFNMNGCFFSVYVQQGNNSDLIKAIVRGTNGWRVSQLIEVSNLVWTQNYRKNLIDKKPKKICKQPIEQEQQNAKSKSKQKSNSEFQGRQDFLLSRVYLRKNSGSNHSLKKSSLEKLPNTSMKHKVSENFSGKNYPELSLSKNRTQCQQIFYETQLRKLLPQKFQFQNFVLKSQKDAKKMTINPNLLIHNHLLGHRAISDKKNLLFNLRKFYFSHKINPFEYIPESHDIFTEDDEYLHKQNQNFVKNQLQNQIMKKQIWIVKPGEDSNRGRGIVICKGWESVIAQISKRFKQNKSPKKQNQNEVPQAKERENLLEQKRKFQSINCRNRSVILQRYIRPLLYQGRKFDIRSYMLVTWVNNIFNGYFYEQCYIRTSSKLFDIESQNKYVHLTNDAVQSLSHEYGKYEEGNKVSEMVFSKCFDSLSSEKTKKWNEIKIEMSQRCKEILRSSSKKLVGRFRQITQSSITKGNGFNTDKSFIKIRQAQTSQRSTSQKNSFLLFPNNQSKQQEISFQLFGLDFMIDENLKLWLIEVNTNPAITHDCSRVLNRLIPKLLDNTFAIAVMPFMRPSKIPENLQYQNLYHHIYQQKIDQ